MLLPLPSSYGSPGLTGLCAHLAVLSSVYALKTYSSVTHPTAVIILHVIEQTRYLLNDLALLVHLVLERVPPLLHVGVHDRGFVTTRVFSLYQ